MFHSSNHQKVYFLSTGRAGTNQLYKYFNSINVGNYIRHQLRWSRVLNIAGNIFLYYDIPPVLMYNIYRFLKAEKIPESTIDPLLSTSLYLIIISGKSKDINVVHLIRDPRDFVTSFMNWKKQGLKKKILHNYIPFWQPLPKHKSTGFTTHTEFERLCWIWNYKNTLFKSLQGNVSSYHMVRFEDIVNTNTREESLKIINQYLNNSDFKVSYLDVFDKKINQSTYNHFPKWKDWSSVQANILDHHCKELMREYNYGNEAEWKQKLIGDNN